MAAAAGSDDDLYFSRTLDLARELDAALAAKLTTLAGRETDAAELREIADLFRPGIGATFTLHCRTLRGYGNTPVLFEVRQCMDNDGPGGAPGTLLDCARVKRRDQGCGKSFLIAGAGTDECADLGSWHRLWRHGGRDARGAAADARGRPRLLALAGVLGHGHGARRGARGTLLRKHVLPPEWEITRTQTLYYSALALYALLGLSLGVLLGRLTRRTRPKSKREAPA